VEGALAASCTHRSLLETIGERGLISAPGDQRTDTFGPGAGPEPFLFLWSLLDDHLGHRLAPRSDIFSSSHFSEELSLANPWKLTPREKEILPYLLAGCRNAEIAERCECAVVTVSKHIEHILEKMKVESRGEAACVARQWLDQRR